MTKWHKIGILALVLQVGVLVQGGGGEKDTSHDWVEMSYYSPAPNNVISAGLDNRGSQIFVARAEHDKGIFSARYSLADGKAFVAYKDGEHPKKEYDVLIGNSSRFEWVKSQHGLFVANAVPAGTDKDGQTTYICRGFSLGGVLVGHMRYSQQKCLVSANGVVEELEGYQVLTEIEI